MNRILSLLAWNGSIVCLIMDMWTNQSWGQEQEVTAGGRLLYHKFCASCHGPRAMGDGTLTRSVNPKPDQVVSKPWRLISFLARVSYY